MFGANAHATEESDEGGQAGEERRAPAHPVADRAEDELAEGDPDQAGGQGELHRRRAGVQVPADARQGGQVHVDAERAEDRQAADNEDPSPTGRDAPV